MNDMKRQLKKAYRMEMMGTGLYKSLANRYGGRDAELAEQFSRFSRDEYMHGKLFAKHFIKVYGKKIRGERFWILTGRSMAFLMQYRGLEKTVKKLSAIEHRAARQIERDLPFCTDPGLKRILAAILPDEKTHAGLYRKWFSA